MKMSQDGFKEIFIKYFVLKPILFIISIIDTILWSCKAKKNIGNTILPTEQTVFSKITDKSDPNSPYKSSLPVDLIYQNNEDINLYNEFVKAANKYANNKIIGTREKLSVEDEVQPDGKTLRKYNLSAKYQWQLYSEVLDTVNKLSNGFLSLGLKSNDNVVLFSETRSEWLISALACLRIKVPIVTLYATLGVEALAYGINQTKTKFLITSGDQMTKIEKILDKIPEITNIIVICDKVNSQNIDAFKIKAMEYGIKAFKFDEVLFKGNKVPMIDDYERPKKNDLAIIMYTSGSTGNPKGVMISHNNLISSERSLYTRLVKLTPGKDVYIGYLPLAHVLELISELAYIIEGISIGYSSPQTLTDTSTSIKKGTLGDLRVLNPTLMHAVPAVLERLNKAINSRFSNEKFLKKTLFKLAYEQKLRALRKGENTEILDKILFKKVSKAVVGKRLRSIVSAGALLNSDVQDFVQVCLCPVMQAYGLTETSAGGTTQLPHQFKTNTSGSILPCVEIRLVNWLEGGYRNTDTPNPRGEIWIGGDNVVLGYYNNKELTDEDFKVMNGVRYFATGDIGEMINGELKIIDRKKDLVKLCGGEFVSLNKVESILKLLPFIDNCCVIVDPSKPTCMCIISPVMKSITDLLSKEPHNESELATIKSIVDGAEKSKAIIKLLTEQNDPIVKKLTKQAMDHCFSKDLTRFEIPHKLMFVAESWLPDSGLVTDSLKIKRKAVDNFYKQKIEVYYT